MIIVVGRARGRRSIRSDICGRRGDGNDVLYSMKFRNSIFSPGSQTVSGVVLIDLFLSISVPKF